MSGEEAGAGERWKRSDVWNQKFDLIAAADPKSWLFTTYLVLVVDGEVVDLNRVRLPGETPVIDQRFDAHDDGPGIKGER